MTTTTQRPATPVEPRGAATPASTPTSPRRHRAPAARSCSATTRSCGWPRASSWPTSGSTGSRASRWPSTASASSASSGCSPPRATCTARSRSGSAAPRTTAASSPGSRSSTHADPSLQIKSGVQWGLFASAIYHLGTERNHDEFLADALSVKVPGAFAMTETGHGSDVAAIGTTATYDPATQEFVIHTPFRAAWKDYLGNAGAARHGGRRLRAAGHAAASTTACTRSTCPIRDEDAMEFLPGVGGEDDGLKGGLNGIDNGRLWFDHVRVPRTNLLNRYGDVAEDGTYSSPIASPGRRFFTMLGTLVQGRVSLDGAAVTAARVGPDHRDHLRQPAPAVRRRVAHRRGRASSTTPSTSAACSRCSPRRTPPGSRTRTCSPRSTTCSRAATTPRRRARTSRRSRRRSSRRPRGTR